MIQSNCRRLVPKQSEDRRAAPGHPRAHRTRAVERRPNPGQLGMHLENHLFKIVAGEGQILRPRHTREGGQLGGC